MKKIIFCIALLLLVTTVSFAQSLNKIFLHFSEKELPVPMDIRQKMIDNKGNTLVNYGDYKLNVYDKRARFLKITNAWNNTYEIAVWKINGKKELLVALCETKTGVSNVSTIRFYLPANNWENVPTEKYIPEFTLDDFFSAKKLEKNYFTTATVIKNFEVKTQFILPQVGNDIIVIFTCLDELDKNEYQRIFKYLDGSMLDLIWTKENFVKGPAYFPAQN